MRGKLTVLQCASWGDLKIKEEVIFQGSIFQVKFHYFHTAAQRNSIYRHPFSKIQAYVRDHRSITSLCALLSDTWMASFKWEFVQMYLLEMSMSVFSWNLTRDLWVGRIWKFDQIDWLWKLHDSIAAGTLSFFPLFFMALSFLVSNGYMILFYSYTLTLTHLYKSHFLTRRKVTFKRVTYSRGLFATYRVLTCVTVGACTAGWALHTAHFIHLNTHIGTVTCT